MNRFLFTSIPVFCSLSLSLADPADGTIDIEPVTDGQEVVLTDDGGFDFKLIIPGWLAGIDGTVGVKGLQTDVEATFFDDLLPNANFVALAGLEARRGKLGFLINGTYLDVSAGGTPPGPLLSNVEVGLEWLLLEGAVTYRLFENDRFWLELIGGARYLYLGLDLGLTVDSAGVRRTSQELSSKVVDTAVAAAKDDVNRALPAILADLRPKVTEAVQDRVSGRVDEIREAIKDRIDEGIGSPGPGIGDGIGNSGPIRDAIREYAKAQAEAQIEAARAQASAAVASARASIRRKADKAVAKAEAKLARTLEDEINNRIPESDVSGSESWVDPFIGLRGRSQLCERWYAAFQADIGGFGINSDLTWNLFGALGYEICERASIEIGYRYLYMDYQNGGFTYDVATKGPFLGVGIEF